MLITYTQNPSDKVGVFPASGSNPVMMSCSEIMSQAPSGFNSFVITKATYGNGYAGFIIFFNITGDTIYLGDLGYILNRTDSEKYSAGIGPGANVSADFGEYRVQSENTRTLQRITNITWALATKDNIQYRYQTVDSNHNIGNIVYFPSSVTNIYENGNPLITYQWSSVPAISGKNGILSLTTINDEDIGDGSRVLNADVSVIGTKSGTSTIRQIASGLTQGQRVDYIWSGDSFKMCAYRHTVSNRDVLTLEFYLNQTTPGTWSAFYSYTTYVSQDTTNEHVADYLGFIIDDENEVACLNMITVHTNEVTYTSWVDYCYPGTTMSDTDMHLLWGWLKGSFVNDTTPFVDNEGDGGGDLINRINNPIPTPGLPAKSGYDTGFMSQYIINKTNLNLLAKFLWSASFIDNVKKFFEDPMQIIMGLTIFPLIPDTGNARTIKAGGISTGVTGAPLTTQFDSYPFGKCKIDKRLKSDNANKNMGGVYFDYSPYTEVKVYLPYCGEHSLDPNDVIGKTLKLDYSVDHVSGVCVAHLTILDPDDSDAPAECHYNFSGQMGIQVPVSQADYSGIYQGLLSAGITVGTAAATIATGGLTAPMSAAAAKAANVPKGTEEFKAGNAVALGSGTASRLANTVSNMHPVVQHTSGGGALSGSLASEYPYVMISEPDVFQAENQPHYKGYPVNGTYTIGEMNGYVQVESMHFDGLSCTESERETIANYLANGVIVNTSGSAKPTPSAPTGEFAIAFLKNHSDPETIGKTFSDEYDITGKLLYSQDISHLRIRVKGNFSAYNYCYVPIFDRFYFINTFEIETGDIMVVDMTVDALQSFKDEIFALPALIDSAEGPAENVKMMMNNGYWYMKQKKNIVTLMFKNDSGTPQHFIREDESECYLLTIAGDYQE